LEAGEGSAQGFAATGVMLDEEGGVEAGVGDIAAATTGDPDFGQGFASGFKDGDLGHWASGFSSGDRAHKSGGPAANDNNFHRFRDFGGFGQGTLLRSAWGKILCHPIRSIGLLGRCAKLGLTF
jgi:hypothetical protein